MKNISNKDALAVFEKLGMECKLEEDGAIRYIILTLADGTKMQMYATTVMGIQEIAFRTI